ncbi:hypothetical protein RHS04_07102 [Rhizoctonia solani]|uniref:Uncharacterized protein n=1 Tax=Rhizoctonia solani TaxID=456999 RepID=A0A8H7H456_9AGAM|nr:hypothetical protein RHS04_07102 [Rhizoctonia solani]
MCRILDAQEWFEFTAEIFAKPDWESSSRSITHKLKALVEQHKDNSPPALIDTINRVVVEVQKFELRIHYRCRVKKPDQPIHPDPFWIYNGYEDALDSFVWSMGSPQWRNHRENKNYPDMLSPYELHYELLLTLELWKSFSQTIKDAPAVEVRQARARAFAAEMEAMQKEVESWGYSIFPN